MKRTNVTIIFTLLAIVSSASFQDGEFCFDQNCCEGKPDTTALADWYNCTIYYLCFGSIPSSYSCNEERPLYNTETKLCDTEAPGCVGGTRPPFFTTTEIISQPTTDPVRTTTESPENGNCTEEGVYFIPYPGDCSKYMICSGGTLLPDVQQCPQGTLFDPDLQECNLESLVECKPTCPETGTISFPHARNCSLYWLCTMGSATLRSCPEGLVYDPNFGTCNFVEQVFCPNLCPSEGTINLPHASNCSLYWLCTVGNPTLRTCPPELLFDPEVGQCNVATEVDCDRLKSQFSFELLRDDDIYSDESDEFGDYQYEDKATQFNLKDYGDAFVS